MKSFSGVYFILSFISSVYLQQDNSHWCCRIDLGITMKSVIVQETVLQPVNVTETRTTNQLGPCPVGESPDVVNFFNEEQCYVRINTTRIIQEPVTVNKTVVLPEKEVCPSDKLICCKGFTMIEGQCISSDSAKSEGLQALLESGLLG